MQGTDDYHHAIDANAVVDEPSTQAIENVLGLRGAGRTLNKPTCGGVKHCEAQPLVGPRPSLEALTIFLSSGLVDPVPARGPVGSDQLSADSEMPRTERYQDAAGGKSP